MRAPHPRALVCAQRPVRHGLGLGTWGWGHGIFLRSPCGGHYIYIYLSLSLSLFLLYIYIYIYTYICTYDRERDRGRERESEIIQCVLLTSFHYIKNMGMVHDAHSKAALLLLTTHGAVMALMLFSWEHLVVFSFPPGTYFSAVGMYFPPDTCFSRWYVFPAWHSDAVAKKRCSFGHVLQPWVNTPTGLTLPFCSKHQRKAAGRDE